jgi:hypothetical protein
MNGTGKQKMMIKRRKFERSVTVLHLRSLAVMCKDGKSFEGLLVG